MRDGESDQLIPLLVRSKIEEIVERILQFMELKLVASYAHSTSDHHGFFGRDEVKFDGVFPVSRGQMLSKHWVGIWPFYETGNLPVYI